MKRNIILFFMLAAVIILLVLINLCFGSTDIGLLDIPSALFGDDVNSRIIREIRLPRIAAAAVLGGGLALSGYLLQSFFANPIAGPFVLGISSGAKLVVAILMVAAWKSGFAISSGMMIGAAFVGAILATLLVLLAAGRVKNMAVLIVCGVMIGYICSAFTELLVTFADDSNIVNLHNWSMGSFSGISWRDVRIFTPVCLVGIIMSVLLSKKIEAYLYGEGYAKSLGVNVRFFRMLLIFTSSILSAAVTAFAGPISFVGIAVPHVMRRLFKTSKPAVIIMASVLGGAAFCLMCDLFARGLFAPVELSISTITAVFGAPIVINMCLKRKRG